MPFTNTPLNTQRDTHTHGYIYRYISMCELAAIKIAVNDKRML